MNSMRFGALLIAAEIDRAVREKSDSLIGLARAHRNFRQAHQTPVRDDALGCRRTAAPTGASAAGRRAVRRGNASLCCFDFDVVGERGDMFDVRTRRVDRAADRGDLGNGGREESRHIDDRGAVGAVCVDGEHRNDGPVVLALHGFENRERTVGSDRK